MGTIIRFPKQWQDADINYYGLELFVESYGKFWTPCQLKRARQPDKNLTEWSKGCLSLWMGAERPAKGINCQSGTAEEAPTGGGGD